MSLDLVTRFMRLFDGYSQAYGQFTFGKANDLGKVVGSKIQTLRGQVTAEEFRAHLNGLGTGLGIIMLRDNDTVVFGAIDYDNKTMDHVSAERMVRQLELPLVLCRSKSGGGHFYCFTSEPVPADLMRKRLGEWAALLRMAATTEIFPKQSTRFNADDVGSWINLPYYQAKQTTRYAIIDGKSAPFEQFLEYAESKRLTFEELDDFRVEIPESDLFLEGPPCLQLLHSQGGFITGTKKDGMFNVGVYLRKRFPDSWEIELEKYNRVMADLRADEIVTLQRSLGKKDYSYKCKLAPINAVCQRKECLRREFGVGMSSEEIDVSEMSSLTRYEPSNPHDEPVWGLEVRGRRVRLTNAEFYSQAEFRRTCLAKAGFLPPTMSPPKWDRFQRELLATMTVVSMPEDAGPMGQLWKMIETFGSQRIIALEPEGVLRGSPYRSDRDDRIYFRSSDLFRYLTTRRVRFREQDVWSLLRDHNGGDEVWEMGGAHVPVWWIPTPSLANIVPKALDGDDEAQLKNGEQEPF